MFELNRIRLLNIESLSGGRGGGGRGGRGYMGGGRGGGRGGRGRGGGRGGGRPDPSKAKKSGGIAAFSGTKVTFD